MTRLILSVLLICFAQALPAQERTPSHCIAVADVPGVSYVHQARFAQPLPDETVRLSYVDHATFLIETAGGLSVATDYTGFLGVVDFVPDVVTMNHAHDSHWTAFPDPRIPNVLKGWGEGDGSPANHRLDLGEMLIRSVSTDIRSRFGTGVEENGNSIFVFEISGLCIGHLGHLHHEPSAEQYAALGRLDVVMAPVDGGLTLPRPTLIKMLQRLRSSIVIPMHWFGRSNLDLFVEEMRAEFEVVPVGASFLEVSLQRLPGRPTLMILEPEYLRLDDP
ncbi:MBL fold metallo-hydrolase [Actibacterium sp. 188UL27-1]|uniref:MBL fold metallo-hydrolase n=1 Tax=Actibacterium sp. 188UL27-1 TaxID=2786961 RepID=UPI001956BEC5|nr:MBL fold metallo-hydrolase [Actibacterium sp. 188UL27-1]MBM7066928.1 MBL fold metallo-hydrolase [Actibacterium sp. 188UL27-1]